MSDALCPLVAIFRSLPEHPRDHGQPEIGFGPYCARNLCALWDSNVSDCSIHNASRMLTEIAALLAAQS